MQSATGATDPPMAAMNPQQQLQEQAYASGASQHQSTDEVRTLWIGDLQHWMEETYVYGCFAHTGEVLNVKIIRNKATGQSQSYGFIEFNSHAAAERILKTYNGQLMPNVEQKFMLNWASFGSEDKRQDDSADFRSVGVGQQQDPKATYESTQLTESVPDDATIFVAGFDSNFTEEYLGGFFSPFGELSHVHIPLGKGYGFVKFVNRDCAEEAMHMLNGYPSGAPLGDSKFQLSWGSDC